MQNKYLPNKPTKVSKDIQLKVSKKGYMHTSARQYSA